MKKPDSPVTATGYCLVLPPRLPAQADPWNPPGPPAAEAGAPSPFPLPMPDVAPLPSLAERKAILEGDVRSLLPEPASTRPQSDMAGDERDRLIEAQARQIEVLERHIARLERLLATALDE